MRLRYRVGTISGGGTIEHFSRIDGGTNRVACIREQNEQ